jgi:hypothetical protein
MYRDAGTESLDTTSAQDVTITYQVTGSSPGQWHLTVKQLIVETVK